jgi:hypothetical protein
LLQEEEEEEEEEATRPSNALFQAIGTGIQDHFAGGLRYTPEPKAHEQIKPTTFRELQLEWYECVSESHLTLVVVVVVAAAAADPASLFLGTDEQKL